MEEILKNLVIEKKKVKNINVRIRDGKIIVSAPSYVEEDYILNLLKRKEDWILEKLSTKKIKNERIIHILSKEVVNSGEKINFLGKSYEIIIKENRSEKITLDEEKLIINCYKRETSIELLRKFYSDKTNEIFLEILNKWEKILKIKACKIRVKFMNTRWGSCNNVKKYINLNGELIAKRYSAIEYVVLHELSHIKYPNHSKEFYDYVKKYMPNYKEEEIYLNGK